MTANNSLSASSWSVCETQLKHIVEGDTAEFESLPFLRACGIVGAEVPPIASPLGQRYYEARFIRNDDVAAQAVLRDGLLQHPAVQAILQLLHGVHNAKRDNALSVLKSRGMWSYTDERPLTNLLLSMNNAGLVSYSKKHGSVRVLYNPKEQQEGVPSNIFIDPKRPYGNKAWMKRVLAECEGHIHWIDKHFIPTGLEYIWEVADANKLQEVTILSLYLPDLIGKGAVKQYRDLQTELAAKGIQLRWMVIDSKLIRDNHDRWILSKNEALNLPDLNTVISGNRSEITKSINGAEMEKAFISYLTNAKEITTASVPVVTLAATG